MQARRSRERKAGNMEKTISDIFHLIHRVHRCRVKFQKNGNMANVEYYMLIEIYVLTQECPEGITTRELADVMQTTMSAVSKKISILEKKGLVLRRNSNLDRRNVYITLSEQGKRICEQEREKKNNWLKKVIARMGKDDVTQLIRIANRMFDVMEEVELEEM